MSVNRHKSFDPSSKKAIDRLYAAEKAREDRERKILEEVRKKDEAAKVLELRQLANGIESSTGLEWMYHVPESQTPNEPSKSATAAVSSSTPAVATTRTPDANPTLSSAPRTSSVSVPTVVPPKSSTVRPPVNTGTRTKAGPPPPPSLPSHLATAAGAGRSRPFSGPVKRPPDTSITTASIPTAKRSGP